MPANLRRQREGLISLYGFHDIIQLGEKLERSSLTLSFYPLSPSKLSPTSPMFPLEALSLSAKVKTLIVVDDSAGGAVSGGSVHVTLREEALRGTTVALEDFGEVTNGFRVEIDVQARR
ncbi:hypothetical protein JHK87_053156 [Glycine soja]|nr:hypothetical protein JHK87_053156 [Glycine soja]